jgi:hypothetical protein
MFIPSIHTMQAGVAGTVMEMKSFRKLVQWIREEFEAAPDLRLTTREAAAFLGLDLATSSASFAAVSCGIPTPVR